MTTHKWLRRGIVVAGACFVLAVSLLSSCSDATVPRIPPNQDSTGQDTIATG